MHSSISNYKKGLRSFNLKMLYNFIIDSHECDVDILSFFLARLDYFELLSLILFLDDSVFIRMQSE
jgi:hypothetical protein